MFMHTHDWILWDEWKFVPSFTSFTHLLCFEQVHSYEVSSLEMNTLLHLCSLKTWRPMLKDSREGYTPTACMQFMCSSHQVQHATVCCSPFGCSQWLRWKWNSQRTIQWILPLSGLSDLASDSLQVGPTPTQPLSCQNYDLSCVTKLPHHPLSHIGHVTIGGSICMQMLTRSGWSPSNDIEVRPPTYMYKFVALFWFVAPTPTQSILIQVRAEIMSDSNARLDTNPERPYDEHEARDAFERMVRRYGWGR